MKHIVYIFLFIASPAFAGSLWQKVTSKNVQVAGERTIIPQQGTMMQLDDAAFKTFQTNIPTEATGRSVIFELPAPDGSLQSFRVFERTTMEQELADKYPSIKTYQAISVADPNVTAKLDYTEFGFHAMVFGHEGTYFVDPYSNVNTGFYNCYYKKDYTRTTVARSVCETPTLTQQTSSSRVGQNNSGSTNSIVPDGKIRTFRLAVGCTIEYSAAVGGPNPTKLTVLSAIVTSINRVNGMFEKDLAIHMNLVANEDTIIFITSDSYSNTSGGSMLGQNQTICDNRIGSANYDIGHVFSTGGGGVAGLGVVCSNGEKARGVTGSSNPVGDAFDVDYVVHEMGHQFGANHTFNGNTGSCSGNRESSVAYEVGSGTTIMAYAGICDNNDVQEHSDDYFHRASINEIFNYISGTTCAVETAIPYTLPVVNNYADTIYIPYKTNFEITASATNSDGNPMSYCWEEYDLGPAGSWNVNGIIAAPIFRSFLPSASGTRVFPRWDSLIRNSIRYKGEVLPEVARDVRFRCTVRDIHNGYGQYNAPNANLMLKSIVTPSLFRVTSQPTATTYTGNTNQTITWDVANTTASPISCSAVDIYLSLDSARTFPYLLASNTPNDGSESVMIPNVGTLTSSARIKVKGSGNVFFDLNNGWIKIDQAVPTATFTMSDSSICEGGSVTFTNTSAATDSVRWTISGGMPSTSTSASTVTAQFHTPGFYNVQLRVFEGGVGSPIFFRTVEVKAKPTILFTPAAPVTCAGDSIDITADYLAGGTCIWSTGSQNETITVAPLVSTWYSVSVTNNGCTATDSVFVKVNPDKTSIRNESICDGDSVMIGPVAYKIQGSYSLHFQTSLGCDSTVNLNLSVKPVFVANRIDTICEGDGVTIGGQDYTTTGIYSIVMQGANGCDSIVNLDLTATLRRTDTPEITLRNDSMVILGWPTREYGWRRNGIFLFFTNEQAFKPTQPGIYTATFVIGQCQYETAPFVLTGLRGHKSDVAFSLFPNPNSGQFTMQFNAMKSGRYELSVYNVTGQELKSEEFMLPVGPVSKLINLDTMEKGMYFISLSGDGGVSTQSVVIQ